MSRTDAPTSETKRKGSRSIRHSFAREDSAVLTREVKRNIDDMSAFYDEAKAIIEKGHQETVAQFERARAARGKGKLPAHVQKILTIATDAIGNEDKAWRWLHGRSLQLSNQRPIDVVGTPKGFRAVKVILNQMKYGAYA